METITDLWLPILLSAVAIFFASFLAWMVLPHHKKDFHKFEDKARFLGSVREQGIAPGVYVFPCGDPEDMKTEEGKRLWAEGPWGVLTLHKGPANFGRNLATVMVFYLFVSLLVGYIARLALPDGAGFGDVFQIAGTVAMMAYALGSIPNGIFFGRTLRAQAMDVIDGVAYGVITGCIFALMWPGAPVAG